MRQLILLISTLFLFDFALAQQDKEMGETTTSMSDMRKREHKLSWDQSFTKTDIDVEGSTSDGKSDSGEFSISYFKNFSQFELGVGWASSSSETDTLDASSGILALIGRLNFIENKPGNDMIPYGAFSLVRYAEEGEVSGSDYDADGSGFILEVGFNYFPFGEIFALEVSYGFGDISGEIDVDGSAPADMDISISGLSTGFAIYF